MIRYPADPGTLLSSDAYRRWLRWSAIAHLLTGVALALGPGLHLSTPPPAPVFVEVVTSASRPPAPPPKQVVKEPVVIPKQAPAKPPPRPKPAVARAEPEPKPKPEPKPALTPEQILAQLRQKHGETNQVRRSEATPADSAAGGPNARLDPERAAYQRRLENLIYTNWAGARTFRNEIGVEVLFEVEVDANGALRSLRLISSSGNRVLDESAERAIQKSSPFPKPPRSVRVITVRMNPRDSA